jgi:WD40 repeat protein
VILVLYLLINNRLLHPISFLSLGKLLYCVSEDKHIYVFDVKTGSLEDTIPINSSSEVTDIVHHPFRNLLTVITRDGEVTVLVP